MIEGVGGKSLPHNTFANVGGDEKGDGRTKTPSVLKHIIDQHDQKTSDEKLSDNENAIEHAKLRDRAIHTSPDVDNGLTQGNEKTKTGFSSFPVNFVRESKTDEKLFLAKIKSGEMNFRIFQKKKLVAANIIKRT